MIGSNTSPIEEDKEFVVHFKNKELGKELIKETIDQNLSRMEDVEKFTCLIDAYVDESVYQNLKNFKYYGDDFEQNSLSCFYRVVNKLINIKEKQKNNQYLEYAIIYYKYKVDEACKKGRYDFIYPIWYSKGNLQDECFEVCNKYPDVLFACKLLFWFINEFDVRAYQYDQIGSYPESFQKKIALVNRSFFDYHFARKYDDLRYLEQQKYAVKILKRSIDKEPTIFSLYKLANKYYRALAENVANHDKKKESAYKEIKLYEQALKLTKEKEKKMPLNPNELRQK